jgi:hypothetical protein
MSNAKKIWRVVPLVLVVETKGLKTTLLWHSNVLDFFQWWWWCWCCLWQSGSKIAHHGLHDDQDENGQTCLVMSSLKRFLAFFGDTTMATNAYLVIKIFYHWVQLITVGVW